MYMHVYVCMYVCMYVRMYVCMYVRTYVRTYVCMYTHTQRPRRLLNFNIMIIVNIYGKPIIIFMKIYIVAGINLSATPLLYPWLQWLAITQMRLVHQSYL